MPTSTDAASPSPPLTLARVPRVIVGGLPILAVSRPDSARMMVAEALSRRGDGGRPLYLTSANGNVLARYALDKSFRPLLDIADGIDADGQPLVLASRLLTRTPIPERSTTTDVIHDVARAGALQGLRVYLLGSTEAINAAAAREFQRLHPGVVLAGRHHGYFDRDQESALVAEINAARPDILWVGLGVPNEQAFVARNLERLTGVGIVKTCGGLFDYLSGKNSRAPQWMQEHALEWLYRLWLEPRRLLWRYLTTNLITLVLLASRTGDHGGALGRR